MAEREEELKSFLMKVKEENEKAALKLNVENSKIKKKKKENSKIMAPSLITSWQIYREKMETVKDYFLEFQNHCRQSQ